MNELIDLHEDALYHLKKIQKSEEKMQYFNSKKLEDKSYSDIDYNNDINFITIKINEQKEKYISILNEIKSYII